jgi:hypothetical protein
MSWKLSCPVLRGGESGDARTLPDYLEETDLNKSITRKNLYWEPKKKELAEIAKIEQKLTSSKRLSKEVVEQIDGQNPFTWILTVNCSDKILTLCDAQPDRELGVGV